MTAAQEQAIKAIIQQEGGIGAFLNAVKDAYVRDRQAAALTALQPAISVTVSDWAAVAAYVQGASDVTLYATIDAIKAAAAAKDASKLGPLFADLYAAACKHHGK